MPGKIKAMIDDIIRLRADGNAAVAHLTRAKLIIKGVDPDRFDQRSEDDPQVIQVLEEVANELGVTL